jgi:3-deoxy-manno-octulosonate cytidylyltransferase (CMP-KDO synthetase)
LTVAVKTERSKIANNPNVVKVVMNSKNEALYFSRHPIPFLREGGSEMELYRHWGIYAFKRASIEKFVSMPESKLEKCEKLEQLRALENGMKISVLITDEFSIGIDTPEDLEEAKKFLDSNRANF